MVKLLVPLMWAGGMIPAGKVVQLPQSLEKRLIDAGNAREAERVEVETEQEKNEGVEEKKPCTVSPPAVDEEPDTAESSDGDPELSLGRGRPVT